MNKTNETSVTLQAIQLLKGILSKPALLRSDQEKDQITQILEDINYFRRYANDSTQRREFIGEISEYLKFAYYPKGTLIYNNGEYGANFGVILRGHAIVYAPKKKGDLEKELLSPGKYGKLVELYNKYVEGENYQRKQKKWKQLFATSGRRVAIVGGLEHSPSGKPLSLNGSAKNLHEIENSMRTVTNEVLSQNNSVFAASGNTKDLTLEDKLLVLHHNKANKNFFKDGVATYKKQRDVRGGDTIAEVCLTTDLTIDHSVIAAEDLYVITISKDHFRSVVMGKSVNLEEKKSLFWKMFPQLTIESIIKLCAYVEERIIVNWDTVYREGDEADAIYIVKTGEVQLVTFDKEEKIDPLELPLGMAQKPKKHHNTHKLIVGSIEVGGIFGEDEVINKGKRKHTAICNSALTLLYVLKKHTFYELFEKYFSYIANEFKSILDAKSTWRARRIEQERKMAEEARNQDLPPSLHVENVAVKSARLMKETEAEYRRIKVDRPELVMETKTTHVIKYEQRKSRVYNNRVDILVYDTSNMPKEETGMETISPLKKMHQKHSSSSLDLKKGSKKSPKKYATKIEKVKSNLFEQNQDFIRWKKYYDALFSAQSPPKSGRNSIAINSIAQLKPTEPDSVQKSQPFKRRSFPKLTITTEAADSRTHLEPVKTLNELATPSENNIPTLTCMTNPSVILQLRNNRYMSTSPQILSPPRIKDQGEDGARLTPGSARFFKRIVSAKPRRSSVDYDGPSSSTNSINQIGSLNFLDEPITLSKSSVQPHSTRASMTTHSPIPSAFAREKNKPKTVVVPRGQEALSERLNQLFVANRGKEDPKVMVLKRELPTRVQTSMGSRPGSKMSGKIKTIKRGDSLTNF